MHRVGAFTAFLSQLIVRGLPIHHATDQHGSTAERYKRPSIIRDKLLHRLNMTELHNGSVNNKCLILRGEKKARQWGKSARTSLTNEHVEFSTWENPVKFIEGLICIFTPLQIPLHTSSSDRIRGWSLMALFGDPHISVWICILIYVNKAITVCNCLHLIWLVFLKTREKAWDADGWEHRECMNRGWGRRVYA